MHICAAFSITYLVGVQFANIIRIPTIFTQDSTVETFKTFVRVFLI